VGVYSKNNVTHKLRLLKNFFFQIVKKTSKRKWQLTEG